jgi:hypothetical protein
MISYLYRISASPRDNPSNALHAQLLLLNVSQKVELELSKTVNSADAESIAFIRTTRGLTGHQFYGYCERPGTERSPRPCLNSWFTTFLLTYEPSKGSSLRTPNPY